MRDHNNFKSLFFCSFFVLLGFSPMFAQKAIYGNGDIQQDIRKLKLFSKLNVELNGDIIIHLGEQPKVIVETDENILKNVTTLVSNNELVISQKDWPEPSKKLIVHVYTPMIHQIVSDSWAYIELLNMNQATLKMDLESGSLRASGRVDALQLNSEDTKIDCSNLTVGEATIRLRGYADMRLCCAEVLKKDVDGGAQLRLLSMDDDVAGSESKESLQYIDFEIVNNSWSRKHFVVRGPKGHPFSYGFPMNPLFSRPERWPVGTKVYKTSPLGMEQLILEIRAEDENQRIQLFKD